MKQTTKETIREYCERENLTLSQFCQRLNLPFDGKTCKGGLKND